MQQSNFKADFTFHCNHDKTCPYKAEDIWQLILHKQVAHIDNEESFDEYDRPEIAFK